MARHLSHPPFGRIHHTGIWPYHNSLRTLINFKDEHIFQVNWGFKRISEWDKLLGDKPDPSCPFHFLSDPEF